MGKAISARATFSPLARRLFAIPELRKEIVRQILSGARHLSVDGHKFRRANEKDLGGTSSDD